MRKTLAALFVLFALLLGGALIISGCTDSSNIEEPPPPPPPPPGPIAVAGISLPERMTVGLTETGRTITATIHPADATNRTVTWTLNRLTRIEDISGTTTTLTQPVTPLGTQLGTVDITVRTADGNFEAVCRVTIDDDSAPPVQLTGLVIQPHTPTLIIGTQLQLQVTPLPSNANPTVTWESLDENVATISSGGVVTTRNLGTVTLRARSTVTTSIYRDTTITVTAGQVGGEYPNIPTGVEILGLQLVPRQASQTDIIDGVPLILEVGQPSQTLVIRARVTNANMPNKSIAWRSNLESVARVSNIEHLTDPYTGEIQSRVTIQALNAGINNEHGILVRFDAVSIGNNSGSQYVNVHVYPRTEPRRIGMLATVSDQTMATFNTDATPFPRQVIQLGMRIPMSTLSLAQVSHPRGINATIDQSLFQDGPPIPNIVTITNGRGIDPIPQSSFVRIEPPTVATARNWWVNSNSTTWTQTLEDSGINGSFGMMAANPSETKRQFDFQVRFSPINSLRLSLAGSDLPINSLAFTGSTAREIDVRAFNATGTAPKDEIRIHSRPFTQAANAAVPLSGAIPSDQITAGILWSATPSELASRIRITRSTVTVPDNITLYYGTVNRLTISRLGTALPAPGTIFIQARDLKDVSNSVMATISVTWTN